MQDSKKQVSEILKENYDIIVEQMCDCMFDIYWRGNIEYKLYYDDINGITASGIPDGSDYKAPDDRIYLLTVSSTGVNIWDVWTSAGNTIPENGTNEYIVAKEECVEILTNWYREYQVDKDIEDTIKEAKRKEAKYERK